MKTLCLLSLLGITVSPISLFAASATDGQIEDAAKASYNYRTVLEDRVNVAVKDGVVTLTGTVPDRDQKTIAEDTVSNLPGVTGVVDKINVEPEPPEQSDAWIALKVRMALLTHANVSAATTKVSVTNGVVVLSGPVDNLAQKELTELYAKDIDGVKAVKSELVVKSPPAEGNNHTIGDAIDDASITSQVKYELLAHRSTSALRTSVATKNGVVMIGGEAQSEAEKALVTKLASDIRGVQSVDNRMTVRMN